MAKLHGTYGLPGISEALIEQELENLDITKQDIKHKIYTEAPKLRDLAEGQLVLALVSSTLRLYTKRTGKLWYVNFTIVP